MRRTWLTRPAVWRRDHRIHPAGNSWRLASLVVLGMIISACGQTAENEPLATATTSSQQQQAVVSTPPLSTSTPAAASTPTFASTPEPTTLTPQQLQELQPNELGQVPILMYHNIGPEPEQFVRTPEQLRADLQWLYEHDFQVIPLHDYFAGQIDLPAGKRPVVLTFDDSPASQFRVQPLENGQLAVDPDSAIGILEAFYQAHPDFGRGGHFGVNGNGLFDWAPAADESGQTQYAGMKLQWLVDNGYEIGNHTLEHANLGELTDSEIMYQLAANDDAVQALVPDVPIEVITLPYGVYPPGGDDSLLRGFEYQGNAYQWQGALLVGANPANSPISSEFAPYETARIQAFDDELNKWFQIFTDNPGMLYVSDGNPGTVTVPSELPPVLAGTLDESKLGDRELVRY